VSLAVFTAAIFIVGKADTCVLLPTLHEIDRSENTLHFAALRVREEKRCCGGEERVKEQGFDEECRLLYMRRNREYKEWSYKYNVLGK
jgi:hypothetical protein